MGRKKEKSDIREVSGRKYRQLSTGVLVPIITTPVDDGKPYFNKTGKLIPGSKPLIIIFSYNREEMLLSVLNHLKQFDARVVVIDDGSEYLADKHKDLCEYQRFDHHGKEGFWKLWNVALQIARLNGSDFNLFTQDDMQDMDVLGMRDSFASLPEIFTCCVINDGRESNWGSKKWVPYGERWIESNYAECSFFCPYSVLEKLEFKIDPVIKRPEVLSSGVGRQITLRLRDLDIPMFVPIKSYAYHGDHESVMHPEHRKQNPLISR